MAEVKNPQLSFEDFIRVSTSTALEVLREKELFGNPKVPSIWVGLILDPHGRDLSGLGGLGGAGGGLGGEKK